MINDNLETVINRGRQTIENWINSYVNAENLQGYGLIGSIPRKAPLIDIYEYALLDLEVSHDWEIRKSKILGEGFSVIDENGEVDDEKTKILKKSWFIDNESGFVSNLLDTKLMGYTLIEITDDCVGEDGHIKKVKNVERRNVVPELNAVLKRPYDNTPTYMLDDPLYRDNCFLFHTGLGMMLKLSPYAIYKRYVLGAYVEHAEVFSLDLLIAKTNMDDDDKIRDMESSVLNAGRNRTMLIDLQDEVEAVKQTDGNAHEMYLKGCEYLDASMSKFIKGHSSQSGNYSEADLNKDESQEIAEADITFVETNVTDSLFKKLPLLSDIYTGFDSCSFKINKDKKAPLKDRRELYSMLLKNYNISPEQIELEFGIPVVEIEEATTTSNDNSDNQ